jgi:hypothetical protein
MDQEVWQQDKTINQKEERREKEKEIRQNVETL